MTSREIEEYRALRETIRERSTTRMWVALVGFTAWAVIMLGTATFVELPIATLVPLLVLVLTFDVVFAIHTAVERVGRYIQVFFENAETDRGWEHQTMEFGRRFPGGGIDPLFCTPFWLAMLLNLIPLALVNPLPGPIEWTVVGAAHLAAMARVYVARQRAGGQRGLDLERFIALRNEARAAATATAPATAAPAGR